MTSETLHRPLPDVWEGLRAPKRGSAIAPRPFPGLVLTTPMTRAEISATLRSGRFVPIHRGILAETPPKPLPVSERRIHLVLATARAVALRARTPIAVSHLTAAMATGCWVYDPPMVVHVTQQTRIVTRTSPPRASVQRHVGLLEPDDLRLAGDVIVTGPVRTAVDVALTEPFLRALGVLDSLLALGVDKQEVQDRLTALGPVAGARRARSAVSAATARVHSVGESIVRGHAILLGLPIPETLHHIDTPSGCVEGDITWPEIKVSIEFDGAAKLEGLEGEALTRALNDAAAREAEIVSRGWVVLHLTWSDLRDPVALRRKLILLVRHRKASPRVLPRR